MKRKLKQRRLYFVVGAVILSLIGVQLYWMATGIRLQNLAAETARARNLLRTELEWMRRQPQARAHKAKYRIDAFYKLEEKAAAMRDDSKVSLEIKSQYIGNKIFVLNHLSKAFDDRVITKDFTYTFARYEKLGIVGNNGTGQSQRPRS